jgi:hypothetical protein
MPNVELLVHADVASSHLGPLVPKYERRPISSIVYEINFAF